MDKIQELKLKEKEYKDIAIKSADKVKGLVKEIQDEFSERAKKEVERIDSSLLFLSEHLELQVRDSGSFRSGLRFDIVDEKSKYHWSGSVMELTYEPKKFASEEMLELDQALSVNYGSGGWQKGTSALDVLAVQRYANIVISSVCKNIISNRNLIDNKIENLIEVDKDCSKKYEVLNKIRADINEENKKEEEKPIFELLSEDRINKDGAEYLLGSLEKKLENGSSFDYEKFSYYTLHIPEADRNKSYVTVFRNTIEANIDTKNALRFKHISETSFLSGRRNNIEEKRIKKSKVVEEILDDKSYSSGQELLTRIFNERLRLTRNEFISLAKSELDIKNKKSFINELEKNGVKRNKP